MKADSKNLSEIRKKSNYDESLNNIDVQITPAIKTSSRIPPIDLGSGECLLQALDGIIQNESKVPNGEGKSTGHNSLMLPCSMQDDLKVKVEEDEDQINAQIQQVFSCDNFTTEEFDMSGMQTHSLKRGPFDCDICKDQNDGDYIEICKEGHKVHLACFKAATEDKLNVFSPPEKCYTRGCKLNLIGDIVRSVLSSECLLLYDYQ